MSITASGFRTEVAGRTVTVRTGRKSQTVNICTPRQVVGDYEAIYRLPIRSAIEEPGEIPEVATLAEFATWLTERNGVLEGPTVQGKTGGLSPLVGAPINDAWVSDAVPLVEEAITSLVDTFVIAPYLHRVEHSFHAELISELRRHEKLRASVEMGNSGFTTQLIHKEWPETVVRVDRGKTVERRGLFDIVVLAPAQFKEVTLEQFLQGRIEPPIVIEVGLDYGLKHINGDICKLLTSKVPHPYLIHLSRMGPRVEAVEDRINEIATSAPRPRVAYVHYGIGSVAVKRLNDSAVSLQLQRLINCPQRVCRTYLWSLTLKGQQRPENAAATAHVTDSMWLSKTSGLRQGPLSTALPLDGKEKASSPRARYRTGSL